MQSPHISVLLDEVTDIFADIKGTFIDCTLGYAGHSNAMLTKNKNINLIACDRDDEAIEFSSKRLSKFKDRVKIYKSNFSQLMENLSQDELKDVRGIFADIGVSSLQIDKNERGFSINSDTLDMRMDVCARISAYDVVNGYSQEKLSEIFYKFAELHNAQTIAAKIVSARAKQPIKSAKELTQIIGKNRLNGRSVSLAILAFQAIRIEVNDELGELERLLSSIKNANFKDCKVAVISFHSLEDRIVKNTFKEWAKNCICPSDVMRCMCGNNHAIGKILTKKAIVPNMNEIAYNSRASCAKMRLFHIY
ncbi:16S rRNA (cytosine(1402)-N(4))-methyltransferase RsmH [Campylobacter sp. faydin G-140]|uniref:16S rRNA (cytosine(1402)-N(4))-methyltransferase RsmH n=1 Tax=Campylobacter anatolicus TaxID=2829105 RepID=UPI001BA1662B|nr:16S rRNA (cytosine(1402)-N(4))-methyltransferase RsmH [Campylobacter anatolicus]MBR8466036.1 16S rRNA (cytosine(1402)-N(4))-methyltransferase RsmH [Campylobacter anatolicus]